MSSVITQEDLKPRTFVYPRENLNPTVKGRKFPSSSNIPTVDVIVEKSTTGELRERMIRYIPGAQSIYADEQDKYMNDAEMKAKKVDIVIPSGGMKAVNQSNVLLLEYLSKCNYNGSNPNRRKDREILFMEFDSNKKASDFVDQERSSIETQHMVLNMDAEEIDAYALVLELPGASSKMTDEKRQDLLVMARNTPGKFKNGLSNPKMKRKYHILKALELGFIVYNKNANTIGWSDGEVFLTAPIGRKAIDYFTEMSFELDWAPIYEEIKRKLYPDSKRRETVTEKVVTKVDTLQDDTSPAAVLENALNAGVVFKAGNWYKTSSDKKQFSFGDKNAVEYIANNEDFRQFLIEETLKATS